MVATETVLAAPVFTCADVTVTTRDVIEHAREHGAWARLEADVAGQQAALDAGEREARAPGRDAVLAAATAFRRARRLVAGDELQAWLDAYGLTAAGWLEWVRGTLAAPIGDAAPRPQPGSQELWTAAVCSGFLEEQAAAMATAAAARAATGINSDAGAIAALRERSATPQAVTAAIAAAGLDWTWLLLQCATFADRDDAAEAALLVREDGRQLAEAAALAGTTVRREDGYLEDFAAEVRPNLLAAAVGDVLISAADDGVDVVVVRARVPPAADDPAIVARARRSVAERALQREVAARVKWHTPAG